MRPQNKGLKQLRRGGIISRSGNSVRTVKPEYKCDNCNCMRYSPCNCMRKNESSDA